MNKLTDYVGKKIVIYENTPMFDNGAIATVIDYDSISRGEPSFLVTEDSSGASNTHLLAIEKWVKLSDIKEIIVFTRPKRNKYLQSLINTLKALWIKGSKILS